jgi:Ni/Fe-hydrogenase b-type cytochrome subunit
MAHKLTRMEHPWPAVIMHWLHLLSFFVLIGTGLAIHAHSDVFGPIGMDRQVHFVVMYVFVLTTITRIYWAFFGAGSARLGGLSRERDWRHFGMSGTDWKLIPSWIAYYTFIRKTKPPVIKYGALQKITYMVLFPLGILVMALSGFAMFLPTASATAWFTNVFGGLNGVRLMHYWTMWILIVFFMIHLYLVLVEEPAQASTMLFRTVPASSRVPGDYPEPSGTAGQKA